VVVDLGGVDVIATTGITMLLVADRELKRAGGKMVLAGTRGLVRDVLMRCRLDKVLTLAPSAEEAIRAAQAGA
jgi:anti-anti-sigma factor